MAVPVMTKEINCLQSNLIYHSLVVDQSNFQMLIFEDKVGIMVNSDFLNSIQSLSGNSRYVRVLNLEELENTQNSIQVARMQIYERCYWEKPFHILMHKGHTLPAGLKQLYHLNYLLLN